MASSSPKRYEFISSTGNESTTASRQKMKTVRSHVMKNYLQQQQRRGSQSSDDPPSLSPNSERRKEKQRARSSRSVSSDLEVGTTDMSIAGKSSSIHELDVFFSGLSLAQAFKGNGSSGRVGSGKQPFALDFAFDVPQDAISGYAQLYIESLLRDKKAGLSEPSIDTLNCKGETVRNIKDTLSVCGNNVPESTILAVNVLTVGCALDDDWTEAKGHMEAVQRIMCGRGGVATISFDLQRAITWTAYTLASAFNVLPPYPPPLFPDASPFPLAFSDDAQMQAWKTVKRFPKYASFVFEVVVQLHRLGLSTSVEWYDQADQRTLSNMYFTTMQSCLRVQFEQPWNEYLPDGAQGEEAALMFQIWAMGMPIFVWASARHVRSRVGIIVPRYNFGSVFSRIRDLMESPLGSHAWPRGRSLEAVLATLFYCFESCDFSNPWRLWMTDTLRKVIEILKIKKVDDLKKVLDYFPSTEGYRSTVDELWTDLYGGSAAGTPTLTIGPYLE